MFEVERMVGEDVSTTSYSLVRCDAVLVKGCTNHISRQSNKKSSSSSLFLVVVVVDVVFFFFFEITRPILNSNALSSQASLYTNMHTPTCTSLPTSLAPAFMYMQQQQQ